MRSTPRLVALATLALAVMVLAVACSKPHALQPATDGESATGVLGATASSRPFALQLKIVGSIVTLERDGQPRLHRNEAFYVGEFAGGPLDTVPAYSVLEKVQWRPVRGPEGGASEPGAASPRSLIAAPPADEEGTVFAPGTHQLTLQAPDYAGGGEATARFMAGFIPSTWWAGPDPDRWPASTDGDGRSVVVNDWSNFTTTPAWPPDGRPYFGPDSLRHIPSTRRPPGGDYDRRTFYEIHHQRIYARREGDTVHHDSWLVFVNGGYDKDSPYTPRVDATDPALPPDFSVNPDLYPVLHPQGLVGSPIGFRTQLTMKLLDGTVFRLPQSLLYPSFEPASVFRNPVVAGYVRASLAGTAYVVVRAQDSDGMADAAVADPIGLVALVDAGGGTEADRIARRRVITFKVRPFVGTEETRAANPAAR